MKLIGEDRRGISGVRLYRSRGDRRRAVTHMKRRGQNYFVGFTDANKEYPCGLSYGKADWAGLFPYVKDV